MNPIGQTFFVNTNGTGIPGMYITSADVYFQNVSATYGIELQIRTTVNGVPTQERLPFGSKILHPTDVNPPVASQNGNVATNFLFDTPVFVQSGTSYAIVLIPVGGNPDYNIWTAEIGQTDATTNAPIYTNNNTGDLFLSSNGIDWLPVITEDMKFTIYNANFTSLSGAAVFRTPDEDYIELDNLTGNFTLGEPLYPTNNIFNTSTLNITGVAGTFVVGNYVYQTNGSVTTATGLIYAANSAVIKLSNTTGLFSNSYILFNSNTTSNATVLSVVQSATAINGSNTVSVPDSSLFNLGDMIYVSTNSYSSTQLSTVTAIPSPTSIQTNTSINFTDNNCIYGKIMFNGLLAGGLGAIKTYPDFTRIILENMSGNTSSNFTMTVGQRLIGQYSGASARIHNIIDVPYNNISPQITNMAPSNTAINWSFTGVQNNNSFSADTYPIPISEGVSNEQTDFERIMLSRSREFSSLPSGRVGQRTVQINAAMTSANTMISPVIDTISKLSHFTRNLCKPYYQTQGYYLNVANNNGVISNGNIISQGNTTAVVQFANSSYIRVTNVSNGYIVSNLNITNISSNLSSFVTKSEFYSESYDNGMFDISRYISKNVILSSSQYSEDILLYLGAYRPKNTNLIVYVKLQNNQDSDVYNNKDWSYLPETSTTNLTSSQANPDDLVELTFGFPQSVNWFVSNTVCNTTSNIVTMQSTAGLNFGNHIYISDSTQSKFIVRTVTSIANNNAITVDIVPSFNSSNAAFGIIPYLQTNSGAFLNDQNNNIVRYVTQNDLVFDTYSQFSIKIVPVSLSTALVPRASDMRVLALQK